VEVEERGRVEESRWREKREKTGSRVEVRKRPRLVPDEARRWRVRASNRRRIGGGRENWPGWREMAAAH
jgi:hypothetical protein